MSINALPIVGITMGDPAGIGPEICVKALVDRSIYENCRPLIVGDYSCIKNATTNICNCNFQINPIYSIKDARFTYGCIDVYDLSNVDIAHLHLGKVSKMAGNAAFESVKKAIDLALKGEIDATVTAPINKEAINAAGHHFAGHTEIYAHFTNTKRYSMLLVHGNLRVVHVSTHVSLRQACDLVRRDRIIQVIELADTVCRQLGITNPRIAVAGLNPHCGENGMFGTEEIDEIIPAIEYTRKNGIYAIGPIPPDTVFSKTAGGLYDIVVAMYHDQGHIPLKFVGFKYSEKKGNLINGVNITLGLPIIRVSVDHGTAFDIAGQNTASCDSLRESIYYAVRLAHGKIYTIKDKEKR